MPSSDAPSEDEPCRAGSRLRRAFPLLLLLGCLWGYSVIRGFRFPGYYPVGQWLHNYDHGFISRGLLGAVVQPFFADKSGAEIRQIVGFFGITLFLSMSALLMASAAWMIACGRDRFTRALGAAGAAVTFSSPWFVFGAHLIGFFDHLLVIGALGALVLICVGRLMTAGLVCAVMLLIHEMFALVGLPVLLVAAAMHHDKPRPALRALARLLVLPFLAMVAIVLSGRLGSDSRAEALAQQIGERHAISDQWIDASIHHLRHDAFDNLVRQHHQAATRLLDAETLATALPPLLVLLALVTALLVAQDRPRAAAVMLMAILSPWLMHLMAWDRERITIASIGQAYLALVAAVYGASLRAPRTPPHARFERGLLTAAAIAVGVNLIVPVPLMNGHVDGEGLLGLSRTTQRTDYRCAQPVFANADFERGDLSGWVVKQGALPDQPARDEHEHYLRRSFPQGRHFLQTDAETKQNARAIVVLSRAFQISDETIVLLVGGGDDLERVYAALEVEGREVHRATGARRARMRAVRWNVAEHLGQRARIRVVDRSRSRWGRISVDGFCYAP